LPEGARRDQNVPADVMSTGHKTVVSGEALEKAGAIPVEKEPTDWAKVGKIAGMAGGLLVIVAVLAFVFWPRGAERTIKTMQMGRERGDAKAGKVPPPAQVVVRAAAGEHARANGQIDEAQKQSGRARSGLGDPRINPDERSAAAIELALATADTAG